MRAAHSIVYIAGLVAVVAAETPLTEKRFTWPNLPYKVTPETTKRGAQFGFNICNSTTENQSSNCQTSFVNSLDDFCLWGPPDPNSVIGDVEGEVVAYCSKKGHGTRLIPSGALKGVQLLKTPDYIQVAGFIDQSQINIKSDDDGGELDPYGADLQGNPIGGLIYSNGWSKDNNSYTQVIDWTNFMGGNMFCIKICDPAGKNPKGYCQHIYDRIGCSLNAPAAYVNGTFEKCDADSMQLPGVFVSAGQTMTYTQPPESLGPITQVPYTVPLPKSSNCVAYQSADLYAAGIAPPPVPTAPTAPGSPPAGPSATGSRPPATGAPAAHTGGATTSRTTTGTVAASTASHRPNSSVRSSQQSSMWPAALMAGIVGFGGFLGVIAAL